MRAAPPRALRIPNQIKCGGDCIKKSEPISNAIRSDAHAPRALYCTPTRYAPIALKHRPPRRSRGNPTDSLLAFLIRRGGFKMHFQKGKGEFVGFCLSGRGGAQHSAIQCRARLVRFKSYLRKKNCLPKFPTLTDTKSKS